MVRAGLAELCLSAFPTGGFGLSSCLSAGTAPGSGGKSTVVNAGTVGVRLSAFRIGGFCFDACCLDRMYSMRLGQLAVHYLVSTKAIGTPFGLRFT